jgi:preprotein translocase subunit SecF
MKSKILAILFISMSLISFSQETEVAEDSNSIEGQFDKIYRTSTTYQVYKVIGKDRYQVLKKNVLDSLKNAKSLISEKENLLKVERDNIKKTKDALTKTQLDLETANKKENSISLFGAQLSKTTYNLTLWSIIIISLLALVYFIFKFSQSNVITKEAQNNLLDVEQDFEEHRKKSLEREQKLRRQLQDEVNKVRNT